MSGLGGLIFGIPLIVAAYASFLIVRRERVRRESGLLPSTPKPALIVYRVIAWAIVALAAYAVFMSVTTAIEQGVL